MPRYSGYSPSEKDTDLRHNSCALAVPHTADCDDCNFRTNTPNLNGPRSSPFYRAGVTSNSQGSTSGQYHSGSRAQGLEQYMHIGSSPIPPADWSIHGHYGNLLDEAASTHGRRNSITASETSTGASSEYIVDNDLNSFGYRGADDLNHSGYMPPVSLGDSLNNLGPETPFDIIPGPSSQIVSTHNRIVRESMYQNKHAHIACMTIIEIMSKIRLKVSHAGIVESVNPVDRDNVFAELEAFTTAAALELQNWIRAGSQRRVGTTANIRVATARRTSRDGAQLFWCSWCGLVTTTKNNLGNHVRSHLGFHISFCNSCPFSSVTSRIPDRHRASCERRSTGL